MRNLNIKLAGVGYDVRITFGVMERIEQRTDRQSFIFSVTENKPKVKDAAWIIYSAFIESGVKKTYAEIGELCLDDWENALAAATDIILHSLSGAPEPSAEDKKK